MTAWMLLIVLLGAAVASASELAAFDKALHAWRVDQQHKYYDASPTKKFAYDEVAGADDNSVKIVLNVPKSATPVATPAMTSVPVTTKASNRRIFVDAPIKNTPTKLTPQRSVDIRNQNPSASLPSFVAACKLDSKAFCGNENPFATTVCLQMHRDRLSPLCREYHSAKMNCYMDVIRLGLCPDVKTRFKCLDANKQDSRLSRPCSASKFMTYLRSRKPVKP
jgi:hypothetical protein